MWHEWADEADGQFVTVPRLLALRRQEIQVSKKGEGRRTVRGERSACGAVATSTVLFISQITFFHRLDRFWKSSRTLPLQFALALGSRA